MSETQTVNTGRLLTFPRCSCCQTCDRLLSESVKCGTCGEECSCEGCVAEEQEREP